MAQYPSAIKSFTTKVDLVDTVFAEHVNSLQEEVVAVQSNLGTDIRTSSGWVGTFTNATSVWPDLKSRIANIEYGLNNALTSGTLPTGGTTGQALVKTSNSNYVTGWADVVTPTGTQTLSGKTLTNPTINSGTLSGTLSGGTVNATTLQQGGVGVVTLTGSQTLTQKTLTSPAINGGTVTGTLSGGTINATTLQQGGVDAVLVSGAQTLTNKTLTAPIISLALNTQTANYTLQATDRSRLVTMDNSSSRTFTVPSGIFSAGDVVYLARLGSGAVAVAGSGTTVNATPSLNLRARYSTAALICTASNTFLLVGDLA